MKYYFHIYLSILTGLFLLSCFFDWSCYMLLVFVLVASLGLNFEQLLIVVLFCRCFEGRIYFLQVFKLYLTVYMVIVYVFDVVKKHRAVNWQILMPLLVFGIFLMLPLHETNINYSLFYLNDFVVLYLVYENRTQLHLDKLIKYFSMAVIISGMFGLLVKVSPYLRFVMEEFIAEENQYLRFQGLTYYPNQFGAMIVIAMAGLLILQYQQKINQYWFYMLFIPMLVLGYHTISRTFILDFAVLMVIYAVICFWKYRWQAVKIIAPLLGIVLGTMVLFFTATQMYLMRMGIDMMNNTPLTMAPYHSYPENLPWTEIYEGVYKYDPGRNAQWTFYMQDWLASPTTFLFGQGIYHGWFGTYPANNIFLFFIWRNGMVGLLLVGCFFASMINWRALKYCQIPNLALVSLVALPMLVGGMFMCNDHWELIVIIWVILLLKPQNKIVLPLRLKYLHGANERI